MSHNRRRAIFSAGREALKALLPDQEVDRYACPICSNVFDADALEHGDLTLEHVPPRSIGGKGIALTCFQCNSGAGTRIEAEWLKRMHLDRFARALLERSDTYQGRVRLEMLGEQLNFELDTHGGDDGQTLLRAVENDPKALDRLREARKEVVDRGEWEGQEMRLTPRVRFRPRRARVGELKSGFLVVFALFGYRYALSNHLRKVRAQILDPDEQVIPRFWVSLL